MMITISPQELLEFIRATLGLREVRLESGMGRVRGWDSQAQIELITALENRLEVTIPFDRIGELTTAEALIGFCQEHGLVQKADLEAGAVKP